MILFLDQTMPVGRYAGNSVKYAIDNDLQYMIWFRDKVAVTLADETLKYIEDAINIDDNANTMDLFNH